MMDFLRNREADEKGQERQWKRGSTPKRDMEVFCRS